MAKNPSNVQFGIITLRELRKSIYEDINQIQHEAMILRAARYLEQNELAGQKVDWYWNPRQTGTSAEPDLQGSIVGRITVSAEITASENPKGSINTRMKVTLDKLSKLPGKQFYFVVTASMEKRAITTVKRADYSIEIRRI